MTLFDTFIRISPHQAVSVGPVVHPVVLRRVQDVLQRPQGVHALGVDPELEESVELDVHQGLRRRDGKGQGKVEGLESNRVKT